MEPESTPAGEMMMMAAPTEDTQNAQDVPPAALAMPAESGGQPVEEQAVTEAERSLPIETTFPTVEPTPVPVQEPALSNTPTRIYWRTAEILLALIALLSGLVALYLRRTSI